MADLPSNAPQMFQLPGPQNIPVPGGPFTQLAQGVGHGMDIGLQQQQLNFEKQQAAIQNGLKVIDPLLNQMNTYPDLTKYYWPTFAGAMNKLSPDYQLDPKNPPPPEAMKPLTKQLGMVMQGITEGSISMDQGHMMAKGIISENMPKPAPMTPEKSVNAGMDYISQSPLKMQPDMMNYLKMTPQYQQMQSNQELQKQQTLQSTTLKNENTNAANASFRENQEVKDYSQMVSDHTQAADALSSPLMYQPEGSLTPDQHQAVLYAQKDALLKAVQMSTPASHRPANFNAIADLEKSGSLPSQFEAQWTRLSSDKLLTPAMLTGFRTNLTNKALSIEKEQTTREKNAAILAQSKGLNPAQIIEDKRTSGVVSSSPFFPKKSTDQTPLIGHTRQITGDDGKPATIVFNGGDPTKRHNWAAVSGNFDSNAQVQAQGK